MSMKRFVTIPALVAVLALASACGREEAKDSASAAGRAGEQGRSAAEMAAGAVDVAAGAAERTAEAARERATQAAEAARDTATEAMDSARDAASKTAGSARDAAAQATGAVRGTASDAAGALGAGDPVARCRDLAARGAWAEALEPCSRAHAARPDDMAIEHALQQARSAAGS